MSECTDIPPPPVHPSHLADSVGFESLTNLHSESQWKCLYKRLLKYFAHLPPDMIRWCDSYGVARLVRMSLNHDGC